MAGSQWCLQPVHVLQQLPLPFPSDLCPPKTAALPSALESPQDLSSPPLDLEDPLPRRPSPPLQVLVNP